MENGAPVEGSPNVDQVVIETPTVETANSPPLQARWSRLIIPGASRARLPDLLMLGSYVNPVEWGHPSMDTPALSPDEAQSIIDRWNPFNKKDYFISHMSDLYPNLLRISVVARAEEYSIPFPVYMDKKSYQRVAEDGMFIHNHDFEKTVELVWLDF